MIVSALCWIFPAYVANAAPTLVKGKRPMDFGRRFVDSQPIFGENKTIEGFAFGLIAGSLVAFMQASPPNSMMALGAVLGDLLGSFFKRRLRIRPGEPLPPVDQLDFLLGALLFSLPFSWKGWGVAVVVIIITPVVHVFTHAVGYLLGLLRQPI